MMGIYSWPDPIAFSHTFYIQNYGECNTKLSTPPTLSPQTRYVEIKVSLCLLCGLQHSAITADFLEQKLHNSLLFSLSRFFLYQYISDRTATTSNFFISYMYKQLRPLIERAPQNDATSLIA